MLFVVPTPIGNLGDITYRGVEVLRSVDVVLAEDRRRTRILFDRYDIGTPTLPYHAFNEHRVLKATVESLVSGQKMALVTDSGMPAISDPGYLLIREALKAKVSVEVLPGASSLLPALLKSGFPANHFFFEGFLPRKKHRKLRLERLGGQGDPVIIFESPRRILSTLREVRQIMGNIRVSVSRELTKIHEQTLTGTVEEVISHFEGVTPRGEFVLVLLPGSKGEEIVGGS